MSKELIAKRIAEELKDGDVVNLGIGLPTLVANFVSEDIEVFLQSENGLIGLGGAPTDDEADYDLTNAGGVPVTLKSGGMYFDSSISFGIIRGGHVDITVLGALEIDENGHLANWIIPGKLVPGMGGAMDLVTGSKKVIVATTHTNKGKPKILKKCSLPLTSRRPVDMIVTEMAVIEVTPKGLVLKEVTNGHTVEDVVNNTQAKLIIDENLKG